MLNAPSLYLSFDMSHVGIEPGTSALSNFVHFGLPTCPVDQRMFYFKVERLERRYP